MSTLQAIIAAVICLLTIVIGILAMKKEPYQASIKNGGFSSNGTKNTILNRRLLILSIAAGILIMILLLAF